MPTKVDDSLISTSYGFAFNPEFLKRKGYDKLSDLSILFPRTEREKWERIGRKTNASNHNKNQMEHSKRKKQTTNPPIKQHQPVKKDVQKRKQQTNEHEKPKQQELKQEEQKQQEQKKQEQKQQRSKTRQSNLRKNRIKRLRKTPTQMEK